MVIDNELMILNQLRKTSGNKLIMNRYEQLPYFVPCLLCLEVGKTFSFLLGTIKVFVTKTASKLRLCYLQTVHCYNDFVILQQEGNASGVC